MPIVYQATNLVNGKRYIGVTIETLAKRRAKHWYSAMKKPHGYKFENALRKYGVDLFRFAALSRHDCIEEAKAQEIRLIALFAPEYNITKGGDGTWGHKKSKEAIERIAAQKRGKPAHNRGKKHTPEAIAKMRAWRATVLVHPKLGTKSPGSGLKAYATKLARGTVSRPWLGKKRSEETKAKISATKLAGPKISPQPHVIEMNRERFRILGKAKARPIRCITDGAIFSSGREADIFYGMKFGSTSEVARGCRSHAFGRVFEWVV